MFALLVIARDASGRSRAAGEALRGCPLARGAALVRRIVAAIVLLIATAPILPWALVVSISLSTITADLAGRQPAAIVGYGSLLLDARRDRGLGIARVPSRTSGCRSRSCGRSRSRT